LKQDVAESSNCDEVEEIVCSPTLVKPSAEDEQMEGGTLVSGTEGEMQKHSSVESRPALKSEKDTVDTAVPTDWQSNSNIAEVMEDNLFDTTSLPPNPELEKLLGDMCYPMQEGLDWKIFSPRHSQMEAEFGNPYFNGFSTSDINNEQNNIPFQYATNTTADISEFLNSVLIDPEEQSW
ncbi:hypothetical protein ABTG52_08480, partial [Acinetobacter baumannii]